MGLFGPKKEAILPKVSDIFTPDDLQKIKTVVAPKSAAGEYGRYGDMPKTLLQAVNDPDKSFTQREWNGIIYAAGAMTKIEPDMAPMLKAAIERYHAFKKK